MATKKETATEERTKNSLPKAETSQITHGISTIETIPIADESPAEEEPGRIADEEPTIKTEQKNNLEENSVEEPSGWRTISRLFIESIFIFSFIGIHWLLKVFLISTGQENEWWAKYLLTVSTYFAIIAFTVIFGCELLVTCIRTFKYLWKNL